MRVSILAVAPCVGLFAHANGLRVFDLYAREENNINSVSRIAGNATINTPPTALDTPEPNTFYWSKKISSNDPQGGGYETWSGFTIPSVIPQLEDDKKTSQRSGSRTTLSPSNSYSSLSSRKSSSSSTPDEVQPTPPTINNSSETPRRTPDASSPPNTSGTPKSTPPSHSPSPSPEIPTGSKNTTDASSIPTPQINQSPNSETNLTPIIKPSVNGTNITPSSPPKLTSTTSSSGLNDRPTPNSSNSEPLSTTPSSTPPDVSPTKPKDTDLPTAPNEGPSTPPGLSPSSLPTTNSTGNHGPSPHVSPTRSHDISTNEPEAPEKPSIVPLPPFSDYSASDLPFVPIPTINSTYPTVQSTSTSHPVIPITPDSSAPPVNTSPPVNSSPPADNPPANSSPPAVNPTPSNSPPPPKNPPYVSPTPTYFSGNSSLTPSHSVPFNNNTIHSPPNVDPFTIFTPSMNPHPHATDQRHSHLTATPSAQYVTPTIVIDTHSTHSNTTLGYPGTSRQPLPTTPSEPPVFKGSVSPSASPTRLPSPTPAAINTVVEVSPWLPTRIFTATPVAVTPEVDPTGDESHKPSPSSSTPTSSPTHTQVLPDVISPPTEPVLEGDFTLITIGFKEPLNYPFVVNEPIASAQIFNFLPAVLSFPFNGEVSTAPVVQLAPLKSKRHYLVTVAEVYFPTDKVNELQKLIADCDSVLYKSYDDTGRSFASLIDPLIPLTGIISQLNVNTPRYTGISGDSHDSQVHDGAMEARGKTTGNGQRLSEPAITGIVIAAVGAVIAYIAFIVVASRYVLKKKREGCLLDDHSDLSSNSGNYLGQAAPSAPSAPSALSSTPGLFGVYEEKYATSPSNGNRHGGRASMTPSMKVSNWLNYEDNHKPALQNLANGKTKMISAPIASENSLGWDS
ncbi:HGR019Cp [Eremothecium sinecaudum]|uniref:HGR019Cp n=1 Tax=Eremothecium sinecaudum TaxID=45286 RepID=A0A0X8HVU9_9SACH|nr:HGR019Cp [Eremothecium sinecaudum]AMD22358.1 HGR019Cp [Eremothecium sinecaudum]